MAEEAGFTFTVAKREFSETAPLGTVISTDPEPGDRILPGDTIEGVISQGKERYEIPDLKGKTLDEAEVALDKLRLEVGDVSTAFSEKIDKGKVIKAEDFRVGTQVKRGTAVDLVVSKGRKPIDITDYTGRPASEATSGLEKAGFKVEIDRDYSDDVAKGRVISQTPNDGTGLQGRHDHARGVARSGGDRASPTSSASPGTRRPRSSRTPASRCAPSARATSPCGPRRRARTRRRRSAAPSPSPGSDLSR